MVFSISPGLLISIWEDYKSKRSRKLFSSLCIVLSGVLLAPKCLFIFFTLELFFLSLKG